MEAPLPDPHLDEPPRNRTSEVLKWTLLIAAAGPLLALGLMSLSVAPLENIGVVVVLATELLLPPVCK